MYARIKGCNPKFFIAQVDNHNISFVYFNYFKRTKSWKSQKIHKTREIRCLDQDGLEYAPLKRKQRCAIQDFKQDTSACGVGLILQYCCYIFVLNEWI